LSNLYYANLDIPKYEIEQQNAYYRLRDFINYLYLAKDNQESKEHSIHWKILNSVSIEEIIKKRFILKTYNEAPYDDWKLEELSEYIKNDYDMKTKLEYEIQAEIERISKSEKIWIKIFDKKRTEKGFKLMQTFFIDNKVYDSFNLEKESRIRILKKEHDYNALLLERKPRGEKIFLKYRAIPLERQLNALFNLQKRPLQIHLPLLKLVMNKYFARWSHVDHSDSYILQWYLLNDDNRNGINRQREFVKIALSTPDFAILEGPPGSGKTYSICELILQLINQNKRVLLCASTHVAVDNVLEKIKNEEAVIAIRIGRDNVSEKVKECQIDQIERYERKRITNRLMKKKKKGNITESQNYLLECLQIKSSKIIQDTFLDAANLICGTTIGILNHPKIRINLENTVATIEYDYLILDEASKTTFQEFLVPALHAKKWIIVGDFKQLSPYVDAEDLEGNLKGLMEPKEERLCADIFQSYFNSSRFKKNKRYWVNTLIIENSLEVRESYEKQAQALALDYIRIENENYNRFELLGSQIIITSEALVTKIEDDLPINIHHIRGEAQLDYFKRKRQFWINNYKPKLYEDDDEESISEKENWAYQVAWRLIRANETRITKDNHEYYLNQVKGLYPYFQLSTSIKVNDKGFEKEINPKFDKKIKERIELISTIGLPSIIESLQNGIKTSVISKYPYILSEGFDKEVLKTRHILLEYQYRMHPEIAEFPRKYVYNDEALKDDLGTTRNWSFSRYKDRRVVWINTLGKKDPEQNMNPIEVRNIIFELTKFMKWSGSEGRKKTWEVAILTFYRSQERLIRKELQKLFKTKNRRFFKSTQNQITVELCVVDRFQGHEADVVFLSFVQTKKEGFLNSVNRLNVALTRAKYQLVIFGYHKFFIKARSSILRNLAEFCSDKLITPQ